MERERDGGMGKLDLIDPRCSRELVIVGGEGGRD